MRDGRRHDGARSALRTVLPAFATAKVLTLAAMVVSIEGQSHALSWTLLRAGFVHWDAISYLDIAAHGYPTHLDYHDAFMPGYPLLVRAVAFVVPDLVAAALLVSAAAELAALVAVQRLVTRERDGSTATFAVWAVALTPLGFFLTGVYTESAFLAGAVVALLQLRRGSIAWAGAGAAFALAMRLTGIALAAVLAVEIARRRRWRDAPWLAVAVMPLVAFAVYLRLRTGDPLALGHAEALPSFGESLAWPWDGLRTTWITAATTLDPGNRAIFVREIVAGLAGFAIVVVAWLDRRLPRTLALYATLVWLMAVSITFWRSVPRYDLALLPVAVIVAADLTARARVLRPLLVAAGAVVFCWGAFVFAEGGWIG